MAATASQGHIFVLSDATGETAVRMVKAALLQFKQEEVLVNRYGNIRTRDQIRSIIDQASHFKSFILHTVVSDELRAYLAEECGRRELMCQDLLGNLMANLAQFFHMAPTGTPGLLHQVDEDYFKRIDAIEFAVRHDDSRSVKDLDNADIIVVGLSRTSKTPLSIYLAQEGWKVANIPIVPGMELPRELFQVRQDRVVGFTIEPDRLAEIRRERLRHLGAKNSTYANLDRIVEELEYCQKIYRQNKAWPLIDVTGKSIEEIASELLDRVFGKERPL